MHTSNRYRYKWYIHFLINSPLSLLSCRPFGQADVVVKRLGTETALSKLRASRPDVVAQAPNPMQVPHKKELNASCWAKPNASCWAKAFAGARGVEMG